VGNTCVINLFATCSDGIQNQGETGIDCGGPCSVCVTYLRTFYVSNSGNDNNNGTTPSSPWKTIAKINSQTFRAGDGILFKRGDVWDTWTTDNYIDIEYGGTSGHPIYYGAYGGGVKPIFRQMASIPGWNTAGNWIHVRGNIWSITTSTDNLNRLWLSGVEVQVCSSSTVTALLPWYWASNVLYVYSTTNPATAFSNIQRPTDSPVIIVTNSDYITLQNLEIQGGGSEQVLVRGSNYFIMENCTLGNMSGGSGFKAYASGISTPSNYGIIRNCFYDTGDRFEDNFLTPSNHEYPNTGDGIWLGYGANHWEVYNNTMKDWSHGGFWMECDHSDGSYTNTYNKIHNNYITAADIDYGRGVGDLNSMPSNNHNEFYDNLIYNTKTQNQIDDYGFKFYNNIINKVSGSTYRASIGNGIALEGEGTSIPQYMEIYNNVIANCADRGIKYGWGGISRQGNIFSNNIIFNCDTTYNYLLVIQDDPANLYNTWQNNLFYKQGVTDTIGFKSQRLTVTQFNAMNGTDGNVFVNNIAGNPLFVDAANGNFHLQSGSPAIDKGVNVGLPYSGSAPDIGAFESNY
jgi:hypothetical protein